MTTTTIACITTIALSKLTASKDNVRRTQSEAGLMELCASIQAHGLLQNLTVRAAAKGKYEVVAGARRLAALRKLAAKKGSGITKSSPIPVHVLDAQNDTEVSLAENTVRVNMHVADQVEAFRKLIDEDAMSPEQVADRFGISVMQSCKIPTGGASSSQRSVPVSWTSSAQATPPCSRWRPWRSRMTMPSRRMRISHCRSGTGTPATSAIV